MERLLMNDLVKWKDNQNKKPLILQGVRQCGKTFLLREFGAKYYDDVYYCKFDEDLRLIDFFNDNLDPLRIIKDMSISRGKDIKPHTTLIIFDEIQSCGKALTALKYFQEEAPEYHVIAAGSLLGVAIPKGTSFPVGKVEFLTLYPMNFYEYLLAHNSLLAEFLKTEPVTEYRWRSYISMLEELYREYQIVGGMPEVVQSWIDSKSIEKVEKIQSQIIMSYENDFAKYAPITEFPKLTAIWASIPNQLAKENKKFIFNQVNNSWRAKDLENALEWLIRSRLVYKVTNLEKPNFPISAYANQTFFKLYMCDIGILRRLANLPPSVIMDKSNNFIEFKGAMAENFICCELKHLLNSNLYYWTAEGSARAEVDFVVQSNAYIIPIEVKAGTAKNARSLSQYCNKYNPEKSVLTSLDYDKDNILPLYMFWKFQDWIEKAN